jgi:hypothetical protein
MLFRNRIVAVTAQLMNRWYPTDGLPGWTLDGFYDPNNPTGYFLDGSNNVQNLYDLSGNSRTLTTPASTYRPLHVTGRWKAGHKNMFFRYYTINYLTGSSLSGGTSQIYYVGMAVELADAGTSQEFFGYYQWMVKRFSNVLEVNGQVSSLIIPSTPCVTHYLASGASSILYVNTTSQVLDIGTSQINWGNFYIGASSNSILDGYVGPLMVWSISDTTYNEANIEKCRSWLAASYGGS